MTTAHQAVILFALVVRDGLGRQGGDAVRALFVAAGRSLDPALADEDPECPNDPEDDALASNLGVATAAAAAVAAGAARAGAAAAAAGPCDVAPSADRSGIAATAATPSTATAAAAAGIGRATPGATRLGAHPCP